MKNISRLKQLLLGLAMLLATNSFAQFIITPSTFGEFGSTDLPIRGIGIGNFPSGSITDAALHVNTNYMITSINYPGIAFGEVFRTDAPDISTYWRMLRNGTEAGKIYSLDAATDGDGYHFYIASSYADPAGYFGDIRFVTPGYLPSFNDKRMRIVGSSGYVGIGDFSDFIPQNILHQHTGTNGTYGSSVSNYHQFTNDATGGISTDGFLIGIADEIAIIKQQEDFPILMYTNGTPRLWMHKRSINSIDQTAIGINVNNGSFVTNPKSILHLGTDYSYAANYFGWRTWMNVGTFCSQSSDFAFFGEMDRIGDTTISITGGQNDAVIAWGDNDATTPNEADNLRFIFSGLYTASPGNAGGWMGLEVGRFLPTGMFGIGNFTAPASGGGLGFDPVRRLEIYDEHLDPYLNTAAPQLRLTYQPNGSIAMGINTDFQTTFRGDLYIHPSADGTNRRVGINRDDPRTTLEINSNGNITTNPRSGLQFTDMTNASPRSATNGGVLSLDPSGEVIFVDDIGGGNISSSCGTLPTNFITKATGSSSICNSGIYEDVALNVGIGTTSPTNKLHVRRSITSGNYDGGARVDFVSTSSGLINGTGISINSTVSSASVDNAGVRCEVIGGAKSYGFTAIVDNTNTPNSSNYGFHSSLNCRSGSGGNNSTNYGNYADLQVIGGASNNYGSFTVIGGGGTPNAVANYGSFIKVHNAILNVGLDIESRPASGATLASASICYGVKVLTGTYSTTSVPLEAYGGHFTNYGATNISYGVWASGGSGCAIGAGNCNFAAGYFSGDVYSTGLYVGSDLFLKDNIQPIVNSTNILKQLNPVSYNFKTQQYSSMHLKDGNNFGLIAEDLELVLPELVKGFAEPEVKDSLGNIVYAQVDFKAVNYTGLIPFLIAGFKEQQEKIDSLIAVVAALSNGNPLTPKVTNANTIEITLSNQNKIILNQNDPNPFAENTTINYFIPDNVNAAQLLFYDNSGTILKTVDIKEKGQGSILIYGSNLSSGVYTYTLLADGKVIETKRMVKVK